MPGIAAPRAQPAERDQRDEPVGGFGELAIEHRVRPLAGGVPATPEHVDEGLPGRHVAGQPVEVVRARERDAFGEMRLGHVEAPHLAGARTQHDVAIGDGDAAVAERASDVAAGQHGFATAWIVDEEQRGAHRQPGTGQRVALVGTLRERDCLPSPRHGLRDVAIQHPQIGLARVDPCPQRPVIERLRDRDRASARRVGVGVAQRAHERQRETRQRRARACRVAAALEQRDRPLARGNRRGQVVELERVVRVLVEQGRVFGIGQRLRIRERGPAVGGGLATRAAIGRLARRARREPQHRGAVRGALGMMDEAGEACLLHRRVRQRGQHAGMQSPRGRRRQVLLDRDAGQFVAKAQRVAIDLQQAARDAVVDRLRVGREDAHDERGLDRPRHDGREPQDLARARREMRGPRSDRVADGRRHLAFPMREDLRHEERIAAGRGVQAEAVAVDSGRERGDGVGRQSLQRDARHVARRQVSEDRPQQSGRVELVVAVGEDHQDRRPMDAAP